MSHVSQNATKQQERPRVHERVTSHIWLSHVTHMNKSCLTECNEAARTSKSPRTCAQMKVSALHCNTLHRTSTHCKPLESPRTSARTKVSDRHPHPCSRTASPTSLPTRHVEIVVVCAKEYHVSLINPFTNFLANCIADSPLFVTR